MRRKQPAEPNTASPLKLPTSFPIRIIPVKQQRISFQNTRIWTSRLTFCSSRVFLWVHHQHSIFRILNKARVNEQRSWMLLAWLACSDFAWRKIGLLSCLSQSHKNDFVGLQFHNTLKFAFRVEFPGRNKTDPSSKRNSNVNLICNLKLNPWTGTCAFTKAAQHSAVKNSVMKWVIIVVLDLCCWSLVDSYVSSSYFKDYYYVCLETRW